MVTEFTLLPSLLGGILIGVAAVLLFYANGRIAGISGIFASLITTPFNEAGAWRALFLLGLIGGAAAMSLVGAYDPQSVRFPTEGAMTAIAGLIVGLGTAIGGGCTSGHGICGIARLSPRSITATAVFMAVAFVTVYAIRHVI